MIFADFEKIEFVLFGFNLREPMALITDSILGGLSIYFGFRLLKLQAKHPFYTYWTWFFIVFGIGAFYGGLAHGFYNYWGYFGKIPTWFAGPVSVYALEQAMISCHPSPKKLNLLKGISFWKLVLVLAIWGLVLAFAPLHEKPQLGFLPIAINTILGVSATAGGLGWYYYKKGISIYYKYFALGVLVMLPSAFVFLMKINLHPWFDKNDLSHVLMAAGIIYFFIGIIRMHKAGLNQDPYI
jgi:hypothetical protein